MNLEILQIASDTINQKNIKNHTHNSKLKNSLCGDEMHIKLIIKRDKIVDFGYQGKSCIYCQASASLLSKISINNNKLIIDELCNDAKSYFEGDFEIIRKKWKSLDKLFKSKNLARKECILLPFKTLKKIVSGQSNE
jgi:nitrogen fixation NifU-like protein